MGILPKPAPAAHAVVAVRNIDRTAVGKPTDTGDGVSLCISELEAALVGTVGDNRSGLQVVGPRAGPVLPMEAVVPVQNPELA